MPSNLSEIFQDFGIADPFPMPNMKILQNLNRTSAGGNGQLLGKFRRQKTLTGSGFRRHLRQQIPPEPEQLASEDVNLEEYGRNVA